MLAVASDAGVGLPLEHTLRVCRIATRVAAHMGLSAEQQSDVYFTSILKDSGCTSWTTQLATFISADEIAARFDFLFRTDSSSNLDVLRWVLAHVGAHSGPLERTMRVVDFMAHGRDFTREGYQSSVEVARRIAQRLGLSAGVQEALLTVFEHWDGRGMPRGLRGEAIPLVSRIVYPSIYVEVCHGAGGLDAVRSLLAQRRGKAFDPAVTDALEAVAKEKSFWLGLQQQSVWEAVTEAFPEAIAARSENDLLEAFALTVADFVDMKSHYLAGHSRRVAELVGAMAVRAGLPVSDMTRIRRAALLHDIGLVAVPSYVINQSGRGMDRTQTARMQSHPKFGADLLRRAVALRDTVGIVAAHHEQPDGHGYPSGLAGSDIPLGARFIAVADRFDELTHDGSAHLAMPPEAALESIAAQVGPVFDQEAFEALRDAQDASIGRPVDSRPPAWPEGLTDREVEVLRLAASGMTRRDMAKRLVVAESTVRHHMESIYSKLGVSTRVGAVLFAVEHRLVT